MSFSWNWTNINESSLTFLCFLIKVSKRLYSLFLLDPIPDVFCMSNVDIDHVFHVIIFKQNWLEDESKYYSNIKKKKTSHLINWEKNPKMTLTDHDNFLWFINYYILWNQRYYLWWKSHFTQRWSQRHPQLCVMLISRYLICFQAYLYKAR